MTKLQIIDGGEPVEPERIEVDDRPEVGSWWWVTARERIDDDDLDRGRQWLACVTRLGSNYAKLNGVRFNTRISFDDFHGRCIAEPNPQAFIDRKLDEHKGNVRQLMGEIKRVCAQLGVPMNQALAEAEASSQALATTSDVADAKAYGEALVLAKDETLPELFKQVKEQHAHLATWMKAELIPAEAELKRAQKVTKVIEQKIHTVELYAGLQEELVQIRDGEPAEASTKVHLLQRRCYMDEECLAAYEAGGMDFKSIKAFDKWIARDENMARILPHERCVVAMRVRRFDKDYSDLSAFIRFHLNNANKRTFLYIRNGRQLWRMETSIDFGPELFPRREDSELLGSDEIWIQNNVIISGTPDIISGREREAMIDKYKRSRRRHARHLWQWHNAGKPKDTWTYIAGDDEVYAGWEPGTEHKQHGRPWSSDHDEAKYYDRITPAHLYYDDAMARIQKAAADHNKIAVIVQGLLDRSTCLHPHPPWRLWTAEGFTSGIELVYDASLTITAGEAPSWPEYRRQLNKSLRPGAVTLGQHKAWYEDMTERYGDDRYGGSRGGGWPASVGSGPDHIDTVTDVRGGKLCYAFTRSRSRATWVPSNRPGYIKKAWPDIEVKWWASKALVDEHITCIDAYTPGDFHMFFDDPRTREQYLQWAPVLLTAENWHATRRTAPSTPTTDVNDNGTLKDNKPWPGEAGYKPDEDDEDDDA